MGKRDEIDLTGYELRKDRAEGEIKTAKVTCSKCGHEVHLKHGRFEACPRCKRVFKIVPDLVGVMVYAPKEESDGEGR